MKEFINELIYHSYKDTPNFTNKYCRENLRKKYPLADISEIYRRIINYQVKNMAIRYMQIRIGDRPAYEINKS